MTPSLQLVVLSTLLALPGPGPAAAAAIQGKGADVSLMSGFLLPKVPLAESPAGVVVFSLTATVDAKGEGKGSLTLDPNTRTFNEVGDPVSATEIASVQLECSLKFIKMAEVRVGPGREEKWPLYQIEGKKIKTRLSFVAPTKDLKYGRLLIHDKDGKVIYVVGMVPPDRQPCHPGCFPAGTQVLTPQGARPIDGIRAGDAVTTIRPDGSSVPGKVQSVFVTNNRLLKVTTEAGELLTTETQPLCLADGEQRPAGELKPGDKVLRWQDGQRRAVKVLGVSLTDREAKVFNLVLGDSEVFVAAGYLVRSKPPEIAVPSASPMRPALTLPGPKR